MVCVLPWQCVYITGIVFVCVHYLGGVYVCELPKWSVCSLLGMCICVYITKPSPYIPSIMDV